MIEIANGELSATIDPLGAELISLRDGEGRELMSDGDPAFWSGRAPLLFPIVGRLKDDRYRLDGRDYHLPQHGFARRQRFEPLFATADRTSLRLTDNAETRAAYPFAFELDAHFALVGAQLQVDVVATNRGASDMPACFGFHPAFAWPLPYGKPREEHGILFEKEEPSPIARLTPEGLVRRKMLPSPLDGRYLHLSDELFEEGAVIWPRLESDGVLYGVPGAPSLLIHCPDTHRFGVWTKPGARFVCIEPWHGIADIDGVEEAFWDKPGMARLRPGEGRAYSMQVTLRE